MSSKNKKIIAEYVKVGIALLIIGVISFMITKPKKTIKKEPIPKENIQTTNTKPKKEPLQYFTVEDFKMIDFDKGGTVTLDKVFTKDKGLVLFAGEWCPHCQKLLPLLKEVHNKTKDNYDIVIVYVGNVNTGSEYSNAKEYSKQYDFKQFFDKDFEMSFKYGINSVPLGLFIKKQNGTIIAFDYLENRFDVNDITNEFDKKLN